MRLTVFRYYRKMADLTPTIELKIVLRDDNDEIMQQFLTNGTRAIPKLVVIDAESSVVLADWGPRPEPAKK